VLHEPPRFGRLILSWGNRVLGTAGFGDSAGGGPGYR
jgi:hypothetical protein